MQIVIKAKIGEITLPINYQHILQSIIYHALSKDSTEREFVHDNGWKYEERSYHMFQFDQLSGPYKICNKKITFKENIKWEIRSPDSRLIKAIEKGFREEGIKFGDQSVQDMEIEIRDDEIETSSVLVQMRTPICVFSTDLETKKTYFYSPKEKEFCEQVTENFIRKYYAYTGIYVPDGITIEPVSFGEKDKHVTNYKGFYMSGWTGKYRISGNRKYLNFLYQVGLGAKNSQGFGMFDVID